MTRFYKMTGSGNDFVMLDGREHLPEAWGTAEIVSICDRRTGAGADGLVILTPEAAPGDVRMTYFNSDGSRAAMCGNAALCSTRLAARLGMAPGAGLRLVTDAGLVRARCVGPADRAEIGLPDFAAPTPVPDLEPGRGERWIRLGTVGVPHLVVLVDDVDAVDVERRGRSLRFDPRVGPAGANANFVSPPADLGGPWRIRTYERGVEGETLACGTGTVAAGVALAAAGVTKLPVMFRSRGGQELEVRASVAPGQACDVWLGGQGRLVYTGEWNPGLAS